MEWIVFLACAAVCFFASVILAIVRSKTKYKSGRMLDSSKILFAGIIVSAILLFIPIYLNTFKENECGIFETILLSIHNVIRLFIVDGEFNFITDNLNGASGWLFKAYSGFFAVLFVLAPLLTFSFVLSFLKNVSAYKKYVTHYNSDVFIFSELNEKSLALAESLSQKEADRLLVFTDVFGKEEEKNYEMIEKAKELGAICFKKDIVTVDFTFHSKNSALNFFTIGEDQSENINQALKLIANLKYRENTNLYVFSTQVEAEMLLCNAFNKPPEKKAQEAEAQVQQEPPLKIKVRRINEVQSLISRTLYEDGYDKIFQSAYEDDNGIKKISALVVGMGEHGTEMVKALSWFCQMDGYQAEINAFDVSKYAEERFVSLCPELMDPQYNGKFDIDGEAKYKITVHSEVDIDTKAFDDTLSNLPHITYVFVALGNDEKNIATAIKLRTLFLRLGYSPVIQAVIYNTDKKEALSDITNFKGQSYKIDFIGDMKASYSEAVILHSDVEEAALQRHLKWGTEDDFWKYDYNYKSSIASAIHRKMKIACGIPGAEKAVQERTEAELWPLRKLEHCRWNAYMRSEGYCYAEKRNDLAKCHPCLIPFDELPEKEKIKDDD